MGSLVPRPLPAAILITARIFRAFIKMEAGSGLGTRLADGWGLVHESSHQLVSVIVPRAHTRKV